MVGTGSLPDDLAHGLRDYGAQACVIAPSPNFDECFAQAAVGGQLDAVVWAATAADLGTPQPLADLDAAQWRALVEEPLRSFVAFLQAAHRRLRGRDTRIVVLIPTIAMDGAAGLAPWATVADGQRALVKSVARVWGAAGIALNCVSVPAALLAPPPDGVVLGRPDLQQPGLHDPNVRADLAGVVASLCAPGMAAVTGATIGADGGRWMTP